MHGSVGCRIFSPAGRSRGVETNPQTLSPKPQNPKMHKPLNPKPQAPEPNAPEGVHNEARNRFPSRTPTSALYPPYVPK